MPRQARIDYPGALQHVIGRGIDGKFIFNEPRDKETFYLRIKETLQISSMQMYAWCIMSNHFHLLIETGKTSLSEFMHKVLTGYAINYNKGHKRKGYLFQNRYKSIVCDKDEYLLQLIRYIHLNPVKAKLIDLGQLNNYKWTGHKEIVGRAEGIIAREEVLGYFGKKENDAIAKYESFLNDGLNIERDFNGGGLIRSLGGIEDTLSVRGDERQAYDDRILGDGDFVNGVLEVFEKQDTKKKYIKNMADLLNKLSRYYKVKEKDILEKKTKDVKEARNVMVYLAKKYLDVNATAAGKLLGITQSSASRAMSKGQNAVEEGDLFERIVNP